MWSKNLKAIECVFCLVGMQIYPNYGLLYPASSVIQLVGSISVPVTDLEPQQRILFDWGFQMNYDMPFNVSAFYNIPIWSIENNSTARMTRTAAIRRPKHAHDFSWIELYEATERILESFGFHASCLLLGICDLMRFPFDKRQQHIVSEMLSLFLKPTDHIIYKKAPYKKVDTYLLAELRGYMGLNCMKVYMNCTANPLNLFSAINHDYIFS